MYRDSTARKIEEIQYQLASGKTRQEAAEALGFKDASGLYNFASKHRLVWNADKNNYDAIGNDGNPIDAVKPSENIPNGKAANIISMFERGLDGREIAKKLRFTSYRDMADFMKSKGYIWNETIGNYELQPQEIKPHDKPSEADSSQSMKLAPDTNIGQYEDLLKLLDANRKRLEELLKATTDGIVHEVLPRFIISGITTTKSINMNSSLDRLIKEYSSEKNISQKEMFEIAMIEFLKKYGYMDEVRVNLKI